MTDNTTEIDPLLDMLLEDMRVSLQEQEVDQITIDVFTKWFSVNASIGDYVNVLPDYEFDHRTEKVIKSTHTDMGAITRIDNNINDDDALDSYRYKFNIYGFEDASPEEMVARTTMVPMTINMMVEVIASGGEIDYRGEVDNIETLLRDYLGYIAHMNQTSVSYTPPPKRDIEKMNKMLENILEFRKAKTPKDTKGPKGFLDDLMFETVSGELPAHVGAGQDNLPVQKHEPDLINGQTAEIDYYWDDL